MIDFTKSVTPGGTMVVHLSGKLDLSSCEYFLDWIQDEIDSGNHRIVVNCKDVEHLSSAGLGMLVRARARVNKEDGFILLAELQNQVDDLLHFLHMDKVFKIYPTVPDALRSIDADVAESR